MWGKRELMFALAGFKFAGTSELWIKTNRDLVDQLISLGLDTKVQIDEKEYEGVNLSRAQREKMILSFLRMGNC